jgi:hypothetical protein
MRRREVPAVTQSSICINLRDPNNYTRNFSGPKPPTTPLYALGPKPSSKAIAKTRDPTVATESVICSSPNPNESDLV